MKGRLIIFPIALDGSELPRLPSLFYRIIRGIKGIAMSVKMRIRMTFHRTGGEMNELAPNQVSGLSIFLSLGQPYPCFHFRLNLAHRLSHRITECAKDAFIPG